MGRFCRVAVWMLVSAWLAVVASFAAAPSESQSVSAETPAVEMASKSLADEIFGVGLEDPAIQAITGYWGRCSQSCAPCWSLTGCPPDDDGTPQGCFRFCP